MTNLEAVKKNKYFGWKEWVKKHNLLTPYHKGGSLSIVAVAELESLLKDTDLADEFERFLSTDLEWQGSSRTIANKLREFLARILGVDTE